jgi:tight adherence protein C
MTYLLPALTFLTVFAAIMVMSRRSSRTVQQLNRHMIVPTGVAIAGPTPLDHIPLLGPDGAETMIAAMASRLVREESRTKAGRLLREAGQPMSLSRLLVLRALFAFVLTPLALWYTWTTMGTSPAGIVVLVVTILTIPQLPMLRVKRKARKRAKAIDMAMPDAMDLLVVCAEGGLSLDGAIQQVSIRTRGTLADEFARLMKEISGGMSRRDALLSLGDRSQSENLKIFCSTIIQADKMGMSIANTLRTLADTMRTRRRQAAETQARKAPIKMMPFLVFFMIPALFVVILGPAALGIIEFIRNA